MLRVTHDFRASDGTIVKRDTLLNELRRQIEVGTHREQIIVATAEGKRLVFLLKDLDSGLIKEELR